MRLILAKAALIAATVLSVAVKFSGVSVVEGSVEELGPLKVGSPAPTGQVTLLSGEALSLSSLRGQPVLLKFGATWCGPCRAMLRPLRELAESVSTLPAVVLDVDVDEPSATVQAHYSKRQIGPIRLAIDPGGSIARQFGISAFPTLVLLDREGVVRLIRVGAHFDLEAVRKSIQEAARS